MRLLDAADVNPPASVRAPRDGRWSLGYNAPSRQCSVHMEIEDPCGGAGNINLMGSPTGRPDQYFVQPVLVRSFLRQGVRCQQDDDEDWFRDALLAKLEYVAGGALVTQWSPNVETWIGDAGVQSVTLAGTSAAQYRTAVAAAYDLWHKTVASRHSEPLLHVPPALVPDLEAAGIVKVTSPTDLSSVFSPKVVASPGYDLNPKVFFSGEIVVRVSDIDDEGGPLNIARLNDVTLSANQQLAIDVPPCSIVRVGA